MKIIKLLIPAILLVWGAYTAKAMNVTTTLDVAKWTYSAGKDRINPYASDGVFVNGPGFLCGAMLYIPGALVTFPFCAAYEPFSKDDSSGICNNSFQSSYWLFHTIGGFPFFLTKKTLWDVQSHFLTIFTEDNSFNKAASPDPKPPGGPVR